MDGKCGFTGEELSAFVDGELEPARADVLASHLETCKSCATEAAHYRKIDGLAQSSYSGAEGAPAVPEKRWDGMWKSISAGLDRPETVKPRPKPVRLTWYRALAAAAMILVALVLLFVLPWGGGVKNGGETATVKPPEETEPMWDISVSEDYEVSIDPMGDSIVISMVKIDDDKEGS